MGTISLCAGSVAFLPSNPCYLYDIPQLPVLELLLLKERESTPRPDVTWVEQLPCVCYTSRHVSAHVRTQNTHKHTHTLISSDPPLLSGMCISAPSLQWASGICDNIIGVTRQPDWWKSVNVLPIISVIALVTTGIYSTWLMSSEHLCLPGSRYCSQSWNICLCSYKCTDLLNPEELSLDTFPFSGFLIESLCATVVSLL